MLGLAALGTARRWRVFWHGTHAGSGASKQLTVTENCRGRGGDGESLLRRLSFCLSGTRRRKIDFCICLQVACAALRDGLSRWPSDFSRHDERGRQLRRPPSRGHISVETVRLSHSSAVSEPLFFIERAPWAACSRHSSACLRYLAASLLDMRFGRPCAFRSTSPGCRLARRR